MASRLKARGRRALNWAKKHPVSTAGGAAALAFGGYKGGKAARRLHRGIKKLGGYKATRARVKELGGIRATLKGLRASRGVGRAGRFASMFAALGGKGPLGILK